MSEFLVTQDAEATGIEIPSGNFNHSTHADFLGVEKTFIKMRQAKLTPYLAGKKN